jgi:hypothetical protein
VEAGVYTQMVLTVLFLDQALVFLALVVVVVVVAVVQALLDLKD